MNLLAFNAVPAGLDQTQLMLFPEAPEQLICTAAKMELVLAGPQHALLIQGDDELGAFADIHRKLYDARIKVYASSGVADGHGGYGYIVYVRSQDIESAARATRSPSNATAPCFST